MKNYTYQFMMATYCKPSYFKLAFWFRLGMLIKLSLISRNLLVLLGCLFGEDIPIFFMENTPLNIY